MDVNVKVAVRCRPLSTKEQNRGCQSIISVTDRTVKVAAIDGQHPERDFTFDYCYYTDTTQDQVYNDIGAPVINQALDGFNGTIFAYGQTGSGKSHSMMGSEQQKGIIPRLNDDLWLKVNEKLVALKEASTDGETKYMITVSFLEIYNENIKDLLNPSDKALKIRESTTTGVYVEGLCELIVKDSADVLRLIEQGNTVRRVAATNMNEQSSRSHSCFTIKIERKTVTALGGGITREQFVKAKLNLVDLAGSERATKTGATGATLKEGANINMSLMALGNVINALAEGTKGAKKYVPYRDSKLTRLLQESLGGNSATIMIAAISPADYNYDETVSTLKYANRAKSIENAVTKNEDMNERMIRDLKDEIERLKQQLQTGAGGAGGPADPEVERKIREMEEAQQNAWEEREKLQRALEEERQANMNTAISSMMKNVKEQKVNQMKNIKRLTNEKTTLTKKFKDVKESNAALKSSLDDSMKEYQRLQQEYDNLSVSAEEGVDVHEAAELIASKMADLLSQIESERTEWLEQRDQIKQIKDRLKDIEDEMTDERAELVATAGLLDQNDKLRAQIQAEEREKAKAMIEAELELAKQKLDKEREQVLGNLQEEVSAEMAQLRAHLAELQSQLKVTERNLNESEERNKQLRDYADSLESRLADAEVAQEASQAEVERLTTEVQKAEEKNYELDGTIDELKQQIEAERAIAAQRVEDAHTAARAAASASTDSLSKRDEERQFEMFRSLMDGFEKERSSMGRKLADSQRMLINAVKDVFFLSQKNEELQRALNNAILYEPSIRPNQATNTKNNRHHNQSGMRKDSRDATDSESVTTDQSVERHLQSQLNTPVNLSPNGKPGPYDQSSTKLPAASPTKASAGTVKALFSPGAHLAAGQSLQVQLNNSGATGGSSGPPQTVAGAFLAALQSSKNQNYKAAGTLAGGGVSTETNNLSQLQSPLPTSMASNRRQLLKAVSNADGTKQRAGAITGGTLPAVSPVHSPRAVGARTPPEVTRR